MPFWVLIAIISCTQLDFLRFLPWDSRERQEQLAEFPDRMLLLCTFATLLCEDVPQLLIQLSFASSAAGKADALTAASLAGTALSMLFFGLAKGIQMTFVGSEVSRRLSHP